MITLGPAEKPLTEQQRKEIERHLLQLSAAPTASLGTKIQILQNAAIDAVRLYKELHRLANATEADTLAIIVDRDNLTKMLDDANEREQVQIQAWNVERKRAYDLDLLAREMLVAIRSGGTLCSIGSVDNVREVRFYVDTIKRWGEMLDPSPIPMCRPDQVSDGSAS